MDTPCLAASAVSRFFGATCALDRVTFELPAGSCRFVVGSNGAGKSTLLQLLSGLLRPSEGSIAFFGKNLGERSVHLTYRRQMGFLSQRLFLYPDLTVEENLVLAATCAGAGDFSPERTLEQHGLKRVAKRRMRECSQGILRRVAFARAVLNRPKVLFLDEPLANLDMASQEIFRHQLREERANGTTVLIVSHEENFIREFGDGLFVLREGKLSGTYALKNGELAAGDKSAGGSWTLAALCG